MRKGRLHTWFCILVLVLAIVWRMIGAPVNVKEFQDLQTPFWQARILLPSRLQRVLLQWIPVHLSELFEKEKTEVSLVNADDGKEPVWVNVFLAEENRVVKMTMAGYVCGVVAAEMPAAYHMEALKAQAVAARTRVMKQMMQDGCSAHEGADICTDSTHCQAYASPASCRERWGDSYTVYRDRVLAAEEQTRNCWLSYQKQPITVVYHAISGGRTENAQTVFSQALPYLVSVESRGEEQAAGFRQDAAYTFEEMAEKLSGLLGTVEPQDIRRTFSVGSYTETGRVHTVQIAGREVEATVLRALLGLRSTWFSLSCDEKGITFHQQGYGHGVGMSQAGANAMAGNGRSFEDILLHYFPGVTIENEMNEIFLQRTGYLRRDDNAAKQPVLAETQEAL
ncbi:MAG: stage II sporulation protein D [Clostridia bacterium]|nr:stage II sporulation protein D [Clostridia bacterium]